MGYDWKTVSHNKIFPSKSLENPKAAKFLMNVRTNNYKSVFGMISNWPNLVYEYDAVSTFIH